MKILLFLVLFFGLAIGANFQGTRISTAATATNVNTGGDDSSWSTSAFTFQQDGAGGSASSSLPDDQQSTTNLRFTNMFPDTGLLYLPGQCTIRGYTATFLVGNDAWNANNNQDSPSTMYARIVMGSTQSSNRNMGDTSKTQQWKTFSIGSGTDLWNVASITASNWRPGASTVAGLQLSGTNTDKARNTVLRCDTVNLQIAFQITITISGISPTSATYLNTPSGGSSIQISLAGPLNAVTGNTGDIKCRVGSNLGAVTAFNPPSNLGATSGVTSSIVCTVPTQSSFSSFPVAVSLNGGTTWTTENPLFTYIPNITCSSPCQNGGTCNTTIGVCKCASGYTGSTCTSFDCSLYNGCSGHGTCTGPNTCTCSSGYQGLNCNTFACSCNGQGTGCSGPNVCTCNANYYGATCSTYCLASATCLGKGTCSSTGTCVCNSGWTGGNCGTPVCNPTCSTAGGSCTGPNTCTCNANYYGATCSTFCDATVNCNGRGTCSSTGTCVCNSGWTGTSCQTPVCSPTCLAAGGTCTAPNVCTCNTNYYGPTCSTFCLASSTCSGQGTCSGTGQCVCNAAWTGANCNLTACPGCVQGSCPGCVCFTNYYGGNCSTFCTPATTCNGRGTCSTSGTCVCNSGWTGANCQTPICNPTCFATGGTCTAPNVCTCNSNYFGSTCSTFCQATTTCSNHGSCDTANGQCICANGWNGTNCAIPICDASCSIALRGVCVAPNQCNCIPGWGPGPYPTCDIQANASCVSLNNCSGHGLCVQDNLCRCDNGYSGASCNIPLCNNVNNCSGNGNCIAPDTCSCSSGWTGSQCQLIECSSLGDCGNSAGRGTCTGPNVCTCNQGWSSPSCSTPICANPVCPSAATCVAPDVCVCNDPSTFLTDGCIALPPPTCYDVKNCTIGICAGPDVCICPPGWTGAACDTAICNVNLCVEGQGTCVGPEQCQCVPGFKGLSCELPDVPIEPVKTKSTPGGIVAVAVIIPLLVIAIVAALVWWFVIRKLQQNGRRFRARPIEPKYQSLVFGEYLDKSFYVAPPLSDQKTFLKFQAFERLLLQAPDFLYVQHLIERCPTSEHDELAKNLLFFFEDHGMTIQLFACLVKQEIQTTETESTLFRANSFSTKMFRFYSKMHGLKYLFSVLSVPLLELEDSTKNNEVTFEVDPNKLEEGEDEASNKWQLLLITQKIFTSLMRSSDTIPPPLRHICHLIKEEIKNKFPNSTSKSLGAFMFLRFYCPAIVAPHAYGLLKNPPEGGLQRQLVLLSKILQNLANEQSFGKKEVGMEKLNEFIDENKNNLVTFFNTVVKPFEQIDNLSIPTRVKENTLGFLHEFVLTNSQPETLPEPLQTDAKKTLEQLGEPPARISNSKA